MSSSCVQFDKIYCRLLFRYKYGTYSEPTHSLSLGVSQPQGLEDDDNKIKIVILIPMAVKTTKKKWPINLNQFYLAETPCLSFSPASNNLENNNYWNVIAMMDKNNK